MTEKARHASRGMMLGQPVSCKNKWKSRITRRREPIFLAGKPVHSRVRVARVKRVVHRRLEWFVVRRYRSILQPARHIKPSESILMQDKCSIAANCIKTDLVSGWSKLWRFFHRKIGVIDARPFALRLIPPNQFLPVAPRFASRAGARSIIDDAAIARPGEAPTVAKIIFRIT